MVTWELVYDIVMLDILLIVIVVYLRFQVNINANFVSTVLYNKNVHVIWFFNQIYNKLEN